QVPFGLPRETGINAPLHQCPIHLLISGHNPPMSSSRSETKAPYIRYTAQPDSSHSSQSTIADMYHYHACRPPLSQCARSSRRILRTEVSTLALGFCLALLLLFVPCALSTLWA